MLFAQDSSEPPPLAACLCCCVGVCVRQGEKKPNKKTLALLLMQPVRLFVRECECAHAEWPRVIPRRIVTVGRPTAAANSDILCAVWRASSSERNALSKLGMAKVKVGAKGDLKETRVRCSADVADLTF